MKSTVSMFRMFIAFMFLLLSFQKIEAQEYLTLRNIYDFDIGDERHYHNIKIAGSSISPSLVYDECVNISVADKYFSSGNDTVFYIENYTASRILGNGSIWDTSMVRQVFYKDLDYTLFNFYSHFAFPNNSSPDYCNGRTYNVVSQPVGENGSWNSKFVEGLGETEYHYFNVGQGEYDKTDHILVYYKKGTEEWGNKYPVSTGNLPTGNSGLRICPNPASNETTLTWEGRDHAILIISDYQGRKIHTETIEDQIKTLYTGNLASGIYFVSVVGGNKTESAVLVIRR